TTTAVSAGEEATPLEALCELVTGASLEEDGLCAAVGVEPPPFSAEIASTSTSTPTTTPATIRAIARLGERSGLKYLGPAPAGTAGGRVPARAPALVAAAPIRTGTEGERAGARPAWTRQRLLRQRRARPGRVLPPAVPGPWETEATERGPTHRRRALRLSREQRSRAARAHSADPPRTAARRPPAACSAPGQGSPAGRPALYPGPRQGRPVRPRGPHRRQQAMSHLRAPRMARWALSGRAELAQQPPPWHSPPWIPVRSRGASCAARPGPAPIRRGRVGSLPHECGRPHRR